MATTPPLFHPLWITAVFPDQLYITQHAGLELTLLVSFLWWCWSTEQWQMRRNVWRTVQCNVLFLWQSVSTEPHVCFIFSVDGLCYCTSCTSSFSSPSSPPTHTRDSAARKKIQKKPHNIYFRWTLKLCLPCTSVPKTLTPTHHCAAFSLHLWCKALFPQISVISKDRWDILDSKVELKCCFLSVLWKRIHWRAQFTHSKSTIHKF